MLAFSERLKELRMLNGVLPKAVAEFLNIHVYTYQRYEHGNREPNYDTLIKLANYFNVSTDYLLGHSENQKLDKDEKTVTHHLRFLIESKIISGKSAGNIEVKEISIPYSDSILKTIIDDKIWTAIREKFESNY